MQGKKKEYHILSLSGGKDSTALAFFIKENMPEVFEQMEMVFYDTGCDFPETYTYLSKIEVFLDKKITKVLPPKSFDEIFAVNKMLPSPFKRWCTVELKVKPSINYIKEKLEVGGYGIVNLYVGIRSDESNRKGVQLISQIEKDYVKPIYPFIENLICKKDVGRILNEVGIGVPDYYKYRSRNGCYFCFYQNHLDWVTLYEKHPDLFFKAVQYEQESTKGHTRRFGWNPDMTLLEIIEPQNIEIIKEKYRRLNEKRICKKNIKSLLEQF